MFTSICGQDAMPRVVIATTMWGKVDKDEENTTGRRAERRLLERYLGTLDARPRVSTKHTSPPGASLAILTSRSGEHFLSFHRK
jgi:hypothetical protein